MEGKVLIVDDDAKLRKLLQDYLQEYGFEILTLADGVHVLQTVQAAVPDIILLDVMLPGKNGLDVLKDLRTVSSVPVIMLTARGEEIDRVVGLELGADDYLPKPCSPRELLARIRAVLRRSTAEFPVPTASEAHVMIQAGGMVLNTATQTAWLDNHEVELSTTEYKILRALMERPNTVRSRDELMTLAQGRDFAAFDRSIDVHISKLRAKLEMDPRTPQRIKTVWGAGYMFVDRP
jgi:two-component system, OmpR family, phosphate regulon response regulator OmpR